MATTWSENNSFSQEVSSISSELSKKYSESADEFIEANNKLTEYLLTKSLVNQVNSGVDENINKAISIEYLKMSRMLGND
jgi:K+-transporting ATPase c subunit